MPNQLEQLKAFSAIAVETADVQSIHAAATNVVISAKEVLKQVRQDAGLLSEAISESKSHHWSSYRAEPKAVASQLAVNLIKQVLSKIPGQVFIDLDVELAFDAEGLFNQACALHDIFRYHPVDTSRVVVSTPATWQGIEAARRLQKSRIKTNLSMVYSFIQAQACGDADAFALSVPVNAAANWYKHNEPESYFENNDPGVQTAVHIHTNLQYLAYNTKIIASGFGSLAQLRELAGCHCLSLTSENLQQLTQEQAIVERKLDKAPETFERPPEITEKDFHWYLTSNAMAYNQLGNDIRKLANEQRELEDFIKQTIELD